MVYRIQQYTDKLRVVRGSALAGQIRLGVAPHHDDRPSMHARHIRRRG